MGFLCGGSAGTKRFRRKDQPGTAPFGPEQPFGESKSSDFPMLRISCSGG